MDNGQTEKPRDKSIWKKKWQWWQIVLVLGWLYFLANRLQNNASSSEISLLVIIWLAILGVVIWQVKKS